MASPKKPATRSRSNNRRPSSSRSASRRSSQSTPSFYAILFKISRNPVGKAFLLILGVLMLVGVDILLTLNNFDRFFVLLGIEIILAILIGWVILVLKDRIKDKN